MYDRMIGSGCDEKFLIITGNPAFDCLPQYVPIEKKEIFDIYGEDYVLFIGEPFNKRLLCGDEKDVLGYTEAEVLKVTADALQVMEEVKYKLVFRPHPRGGCPGEIQAVINSHSNIDYDAGIFYSRDLVACARAVVGMTSMLLYEASVMGVPAISIRPNKRLSSDLIDCCSKIPVETSFRIDDVVMSLRQILSAKSESRPICKSSLFDAICASLSKPVLA
jgi:hypothetical protein